MVIWIVTPSINGISVITHYAVTVPSERRIPGVVPTPSAGSIVGKHVAIRESEVPAGIWGVIEMRIGMPKAGVPVVTVIISEVQSGIIEAIFISEIINFLICSRLFGTTIVSFRERRRGALLCYFKLRVTAR